MDLRKDDPYVSCIKIRGVPIIPPLMTEDVRTEMRYYKHLALAVEERSKNLENCARTESGSRLETVIKNGTATSVDPSHGAPESESLDETLNAVIIVDIPANEESSRNNRQRESERDRETADTRETRQSQKLFSEDETPSGRDDETLLGESVSSDFGTTSTDINNYRNDSCISNTTVSTLENSIDSRKPEVPKTLDIIPITVDATTSDETIVRTDCEDFSKDTENSLENDSPISTTSPESDETTPKLVRQGSYVLESPSPMLLAHLQEENTNVDGYVPSTTTTTTTNNSIKRKEWNIGLAKSEWELRGKKEVFIVADSSRTTRHNKIRRNSVSSDNQGRSSRYSTQTRIGEKHFNGTHQIARSADCIRSMLYRESTLKNGKFCLVAKVNGHAEESSRSNGTLSCKITKNVSILSLADKLGGSMGNLNNGSNRNAKRTTLRKQANVGGSSGNFENEEPKKKENYRGSPQKLLSTVTSGKLVRVFREIQTTHERQINELIERQQREQRTMQMEFEKQQILLLAQIEQTFPGICLQKLTEKISTPSPSPILIRSNNAKTCCESRKKIFPPPERLAINGSHGPDVTIPKCPLDDIYPRDETIDSASCKIQQGQRKKTIGKEAPTSPPIGLYSTSVLNSERRNSGVNRQLFPLESKTRHVPVITNATYEERHMKAATVITAYAKGYLVRRMMQTERVIALKCTYGEALCCMLKLHVDAPLALPELNFHQRLQLQCDAASMNIVELFAQEPAMRMEIIRQDRRIKRARQERPNSARSHYSFATQRTLARKKRLKEMGDFQTPVGSRPATIRSRCQTWTSSVREKRSPSLINQGIRRSTSAGAVRKPWR